jgi:ubiquinone/menaquinone biosynthesis C-methylase UbiE
MSEPTPDFGAITGKQKAAWSDGDFNALAISIMPVAEQLAYAVDPRPGQRLLDIACGSGNGALVAARRYCDVTGLDFAPNLLERARLRAGAEGTQVEFIEGDAQALPFEDASFDHVISTFGIMFAPNQERAAAELLRVTKPGGRIGMANWTPEHFGGQFFRTIAKYAPPPAGLKPGTRWGTEQGLKELIGPGVSSMKLEQRTTTMHYRSLDAVLDLMFRRFGPLVKLSQSLDQASLATLRSEVAQLLKGLNRADDGTMAVEGVYAQVVALRA